MAVKKWHCISDKGEIGPLSEGQILGMYVDGEIDEETAVWKSGMASWEPLKFQLDQIRGRSRPTKSPHFETANEIASAKPAQSAKFHAPAEKEPSYFFLRFLRILIAFVAFWQIIGLLPVIGWLGHLDQVTADMWFRAAIKMMIAAACFSVSNRIRKSINDRHERQFGQEKIKSWNSL